MKTKITLMALTVLSGIMSVFAQNACPDWNGYVDSKNTNGTGGILFSKLLYSF